MHILLQDLNSVEMVWHHMKHSIRKHTKPKTKEEFLAGIRQFWSTVREFEINNNISVNVLAVEGGDIYIHRKTNY